MRAGPGADVGEVQPGQLADTQPGLDREGEHRVVASSGAGGLVAGVQQRGGLGVGEPGDEVALDSRGGDREDPGDGVGVLWMPQCGVGEQ